MTDRLALAEQVRSACLQAALNAYEQARIAGLCGEGRRKLAVQAIRTLDLARLLDADRASPTDSLSLRYNVSQTPERRARWQAPP